MAYSNYEKHTTQSANPLARFAHRVRVGFSIELVGKWAPSGGTVVDFGAGTGLFLDSLHSRRGDLRLSGVEPYMAARATGARMLPGLAALDDSSQDVVAAFEVCEHLTDGELGAFLAEAARVLRGPGKLILSVPIMCGAAILPKEINRMIFVRKFDYSGRELLAAAMGREVERARDIKTSHKGFDFRKLEPVLNPGFVVSERIYSPFPRLPWWLNSQVFLLCSKSAI